MEFKLPELGENIASGDVVSVFVKEGDTIKNGQSLIEIETGKAVLEIPTTIAGKVTKVHIQPGQTINVGATLLTVEGSAAAAPSPAKPAAPAAAAKPPAKPTPPPMPAKPAATTPNKAAPTPPPMPVRPAPQPAATVAVAPAAEQTNGSGTYDHVASPASPAVRRLARELGVDLSRVHGTGDGGRITAEDVKNAVRQATSASPATTAARGASDGAQDGWGPVRREPLPKIRKTIAANMVVSATTIPHVTNFDDADVTELEKMRKLSAQQYAESGVKLTMLAFVMKAVAHCLKHHPTLNASLDMESGEVVYKDYVNLGIAVDAPRGLMVPVLRNTDKLSIPHIAQHIAQLADKAKNNQLGLDEMRGGSFTISNMGAVGGMYSTPIINPPEVAILLVGRSKKRAMVVGDDDKIVPRLMLPLSLSYDHRLVDGAAASRFLNDVIGLLEVPGRLLLAP